MPINIDRTKLQEVSHLELLAKQVVEGFIVGLHKSPFHGFSVEFAEHRAYNQGESTKHMDWKLFARTDKMFLKKYEEETNLRCQIVIDTSSSMYYPEEFDLKSEQFNKIKFSVYAAAAIIELLKKQRDAVGVSLFDEDLSLHTKARSNQVHHRYLFSELEKLIEENNRPKERKTFTIDALHAIAESIPRRSLVMIFSDMMDNSEKSEELFSALQHLKHNKHEVMLFHVRDSKTESNFEFENRPYTFIDLETNKEVKAHPKEVRQIYQKAMKEYTEELKLKCSQYKIDFVEADINEGFNTVLAQYLTKRSKLY
ncbi:MAG: DUF58 domain-containing protein [Flavobacteriales bacterium]|nr:DUF58 domain-containing protein [Flavobacteriales bacterium]